MEQTAPAPGRALTAAHGGVLQCVVVTPEATVRDTTADFVALPLFDGELGVAPGHAPMIGRLGYGEMRLTSKDDKTTTLYVDGGFVQVADNVVSVLTNRAVPAEKIDTQAANDLLNTARKRPINTAELEAIRDRMELQARAQLAVAKHAK